MSNEQIKAALKSLNWDTESSQLPNFHLFIQKLILLGESTNITINQRDRDVLWENQCLENMILAFQAFKGVWDDANIKEINEKDEHSGKRLKRKTLPLNSQKGYELALYHRPDSEIKADLIHDPRKANFGMDEELQVIIQKGLDRIETLISQKIEDDITEQNEIGIKAFYAKKAMELKQFNQELDRTKLEEMDLNAFLAIQNFRTRQQKRLNHLANIGNGSIALAFGVMETGVSAVSFVLGFTTLYSTAKILLTVTAYLFGLLSSIAAMKVSWSNTKPYIYSALNQLFSFRRYYCKATGKYVTLSKTQMAQLGGFCLFSAAVGLATGSVCFTWTLALANLPYLIGIAAISAACPYLGIIFAAAIAIGTIFTLTKNFYNKILTVGDPKESLARKFYNFLKEPFDELNKVIGENSSCGYRYSLYAVTGFFCLLGLAGLGIASWNSRNSFTKFSKKLFHVGPAIAKKLGLWLGGVSSGVGRSVFTVYTGTRCSTALIKNYSTEYKDKVDISKAKLCYSAAETALRYTFFYMNFKTAGYQSTESAALAAVASSRTCLLNTAHVIQDVEIESITPRKIRVDQLKEIAGRKVRGLKVTNDLNNEITEENNIPLVVKVA